MSSKPLITVVTPYYNNADTLHEALDSVFTQTYENIQHILVDDGSADFHLSDVREYIEKNKRDHVVDSVILQTQDNSGTVRAWNLALPYIKGEYVFSLAADDCFYDENVLTDWVNAFLSSGAKILAAKRAVYDVSLRELRYFAPTNAEIDAITSFNYNLGSGYIDKLINGFKTGGYEGLWDSMKNYIHVNGVVWPGLQKRRKRLRGTQILRRAPARHQGLQRQRRREDNRLGSRTRLHLPAADTGFPRRPPPDQQLIISRARRVLREKTGVT